MRSHLIFLAKELLRPFVAIARSLYYADVLLSNVFPLRYSMLSVQISHAIPSLSPNRQQAMFLMSGLIAKISYKGDHFALFH